MAQQQPVRVVVEKKPSGCWSAFGILLLIGLAIEYWYVSVGLLVLIVALVAIGQAKRNKQRKLDEEKARHRPGPRDPWLNEVAVALSELGFVEHARNTGAQIGGIPIDGDIRLDAQGLSMFITLLATDERARQADLALRAKPDFRAAIGKGHTAIKVKGRVLYTANGRGGVVDEFRMDEAISLVDKIGLPAPLTGERSGAPKALPQREDVNQKPSVSTHSSITPDALEQIRKLGELLAAGLLTEDEFDAKKAELLRRI